MAQLLVDFDLDGQSMAVVTGDVGGVKASHSLGFDDKILEPLVKSVAEVDRAVGIGRPVVEQVSRTPLALFNLLVEAERGPACSRSGSFCGRLAFIGKAVWGRVRVAFNSGAEDIGLHLCLQIVHYSSLNGELRFFGNKRDP